MGLKYLYVPSGVKAEKAYGVLPNSADADFSSFSRNSAGSRVDKNGFINTGLGLGSEEVVNGGFDSSASWSISNSSGASTQITGGYLRIQTDGAYTDVGQTNVMQSGKQYTLSYTVTESNEGSLVMVMNDAGSISVDLPTSVGSQTFDFTSQRSTLAFKRGGGALDIKIDNVSVREITEVNTDVPRLDYTDGGCPSLLLEEQATNSIEYSENIASSSWSVTGCTRTVNTVISPDGNLTMDDLNENTSSGAHSINQGNKTIVADSVNCYSIFIKRKEVSADRFLRLDVQDSTFTNGGRALFNIQTGQVQLSPISVGAGSNLNSGSEYYGNGIYRIWISLKVDGTSTQIRPYIYLQSSGSGYSASYTGDGFSGVSLWGGQLEQNSEPSSYIPNLSTGLSTRAADVGNSTGDISSVINSQEGTLFFEGSFLSLVGRFSLNSSATTWSDRITILVISDNQVKVAYKAGGVGADATFTVPNIKTNGKLAIRWIGTTIIGYYNGTEVFNKTNNGVFSAGILDRISMAAANGTGNKFAGKVKQLRVYDEYLSDEEMVKLTTL